MAAITFDTLQYAKALESKGFTVEQAEALAEQNKKVFNEFAENQLATKADLFRAQAELDKKFQLFSGFLLPLLHWLQPVPSNIFLVKIN